MSMLTSNPTAALQVAQQTMAERVAQAEARRQRRDLRAQHRSTRGTHPETRPTPSAPSHPWATQLVRVAHLTHWAH